jgi:hypothetical protein
MLSKTDAPGTSTPLASVNLMVWVPELPATQGRPSEFTVIAFAPTSNLIPANPAKSFRRSVLVNPVRNGVGAPPQPPPTQLIVVASLAVLLLVLVSPPPDTVAVLVTLTGAFAATFTVKVSAE